MNYVIVGASAAGVNGAKYLRQMEPDANITLISKDEYIYSRRIDQPLSQLLPTRLCPSLPQNLRHRVQYHVPFARQRHAHGPALWSWETEYDGPSVSPGTLISGSTIPKSRETEVPYKKE